jgi:hypothetical protein
MSASIHSSTSLPQDDIMSLYIPIVPPEMDHLDVERLIQHADIAVVRRVDLVEDATSSDKKVISAFVHISYWRESQKAYECSDAIKQTGSYKMVYQNHSKSKYLILRKMTCVPVPDTKLNIHQVVAILNEQSERIEALEARLQETFGGEHNDGEIVKDKGVHDA